MTAQVVKRLPEGDDWIYELKFDGYRALIIKDEQQVELRSRKNKDRNRRKGLPLRVKGPAPFRAPAPNLDHRLGQTRRIFRPVALSSSVPSLLTSRTLTFSANLCVQATSVHFLCRPSGAPPTRSFWLVRPDPLAVIHLLGIRICVSHVDLRVVGLLRASGRIPPVGGTLTNAR